MGSSGLKITVKVLSLSFQAGLTGECTENCQLCIHSCCLICCLDVFWRHLQLLVCWYFCCIL